MHGIHFHTLSWPLLAVHIVLSGLVTCHVLLRKRDVAAAIGWIGLSWLSPIFGSLLYVLLGVNRVRQRAQRVKGRKQTAAPPPPQPYAREGALAPLEHAVGLITQRPARRGSRLQMLHSGDEAYPAMRAVIDAAEHSIGLSSYILRDDEAGGAMIDALIRAHKRGVSVRVLVDGIGSGYFISPAYRRLKCEGVKVARFMHSPLPWRMPFLNLRTHKKVLVADGRIGFTGGLNIGDENVLAKSPKHPVQDTHFRLDGKVVAQLSEAFVHDWWFTTGETLEGFAWFPQHEAVGEAVARVITSGPDEDLEKIAMIALQAIACARRSVRVMTPYFLPGEGLVTALVLAAQRGLAVEIIVPARSNHVLIDWATRAHIGPLLAAGCIIRHNPPPFDHSKLMVIDDAWCLIGSSNWDARSLRLNFELNVEVYHSDLAAQAVAAMARKSGPRVTPEMIASRSLPVRLRDAALRLLLPYL